jgi:N-acetylmuramoyl-L-alanine amidase
MASDGQGKDDNLFNKATSWEFILLALCAWREARDQGFNGMLAVCWSVRNRVAKPGKTWWGDDWEEVILKPWQYSSFNPNDPNATKLPGDPANDPSWANALACAERAYLGMGVDPTLGATHYYNPKVVKTSPPWVTAPKTVFKTQIGDHYFYVAE